MDTLMRLPRPFPRSEISAANELHDCGIKFLDFHKALTLEYIRLGRFESQRIMGPKACIYPKPSRKKKQLKTFANHVMQDPCQWLQASKKAFGCSSQSITLLF